jgi:ATP synthase protein I
MEGVLTGEEKPDKSSPTKPGGNVSKGLSGKDLGARRDALGAALEKRRVENEVQEKKRNTNNMAGLGAALRLTSEFIAGIVVGSLVGWLIDKVAGTSPFALIVFFLLGFCAGVLNVLRSAGLVAEQGSEVNGSVKGGGDEKPNGRTGKEG